MGTSTKIKTFLLLLFICTSVVRAQQEIIGLVTDKEDGMPISGVQIIIKDTNKKHDCEVQPKQMAKDVSPSTRTGKTHLIASCAYPCWDISHGNTA